MDINKLFFLMYFRFLEQYGDEYFQKNPAEKIPKNCIKKYINQKKQIWRQRKSCRQGMYAIKICESRRKKRDSVNKDSLRVYGTLVILYLIMMAVLVVSWIVKTSAFEQVQKGITGVILLISLFFVDWEGKGYKHHHGNIEEIRADLQESEKILEERSVLLMQIIQQDICTRGYDKEKTIDLLINQCENEILYSKTSKTIDMIEVFIVPLFLGLCCLIPNRAIACWSSVCVIAITIIYLVLKKYSSEAREFNRFNQEELCCKAMLDCLHYIKLKDYKVEHK